MAKIIWLASYPKSGSTWLRALLTNYLRETKEPADINNLVGNPAAGSRFWFDQCTGIEASALSDEAVDCIRPAVYRHLAHHAIDTFAIKIHDAWSITRWDEPLVPSDVTAGVVYVIRNPLDLVASCASHWGCDLETAVCQMSDPRRAIPRSLDGLSEQLRQQLGSWSAHVQSWVDWAGLRLLILRYEDLQRDAEWCFSEVVDFCGFPLDPGKVTTAVSHSTFAELRRQEGSAGFGERSVFATKPFFRRGQSGSWRQELPADLAERVVASHGGIMLRFGYLSQSGEPV